jgi:hypothetical protein
LVLHGGRLGYGSSHKLVVRTARHIASRLKPDGASASTYRVDVVNILERLTKVLLDDECVKEELVAGCRFLLRWRRRDVLTGRRRHDAATLALINNLAWCVDSGIRRSKSADWPEKNS